MHLDWASGQELQEPQGKTVVRSLLSSHPSTLTIQTLEALSVNEAENPDPWAGKSHGPRAAPEDPTGRPRSAPAASHFDIDGRRVSPTRVTVAFNEQEVEADVTPEGLQKPSQTPEEHPAERKTQPAPGDQIHVDITRSGDSGQGKDTEIEITTKSGKGKGSSKAKEQKATKGDKTEEREASSKEELSPDRVRIRAERDGSADLKVKVKAQPSSGKKAETVVIVEGGSEGDAPEKPSKASHKPSKGDKAKRKKKSEVRARATSSDEEDEEGLSRRRRGTEMKPNDRKSQQEATRWDSRLRDKDSERRARPSRSPENSLDESASVKFSKKEVARARHKRLKKHERRGLNYAGDLSLGTDDEAPYPPSYRPSKYRGEPRSKRWPPAAQAGYPDQAMYPDQAGYQPYAVPPLAAQAPRYTQMHAPELPQPQPAWIPSMPPQNVSKGSRSNFTPAGAEWPPRQRPRDHDVERPFTPKYELDGDPGHYGAAELDSKGGERHPAKHTAGKRQGSKRDVGRDDGGKGHRRRRHHSQEELQLENPDASPTASQSSELIAPEDTPAVPTFNGEPESKVEGEGDKRNEKEEKEARKRAKAEEKRRRKAEREAQKQAQKEASREADELEAPSSGTAARAREENDPILASLGIFNTILP